MKFLNKIVLFMLVAAILPASATSYATPDILIDKLPYGKKVSVEINNLKGSAAIRILNEEEVAVQEIKVEAPGQRAVKIFNLEALQEGAYSIVVTTYTKEMVQPFEITENDIVLNKEKHYVYLIPSIKVSDDYLDINWLNTNISRMSVEIQTENGISVYEEEMNNILKVERRYNVAQLERGDYQVIVTTPFKSYYHSITLD